MILLRFVPIVLLIGCVAAAEIPGPRVLPHHDARIAVFIQLSGTTLTLLPRLLRSVWHEDNIYILHFDKKIPQWQREHTTAVLFKSNKMYHRNVHVLQSEVITYRGISMVLNTMNAMQLAIDTSDDWDFFINISGSDYPLVSPDNLRRLLGTNDFLYRNRSFFSFANPNWWAKSKTFRFDRLFTDTSLSMNDSHHSMVDSYTDQPIAHTAAFTYVAGEAWMTLHRSLVLFLLKSPYARRMFTAFAYSAEPEEHFFISTAFNSEQFNATIVPHALRHVMWVYNETHAGQHPYYVDQLEPDGKTWTFRKYVENSGCFFTRKIRKQDSAFLNYIDKNLNGLAPDADVGAVQGNLKRVSERLECLAQLRGAEDYSPCFPKMD